MTVTVTVGKVTKTVETDTVIITEQELGPEEDDVVEEEFVVAELEDIDEDVVILDVTRQEHALDTLDGVAEQAERKLARKMSCRMMTYGGYKMRHHLH